MKPLVFVPYLRPQIWGGRRLADVFNKQLPHEGTFGESWELSAHPLHVSKVAEGPLEGTDLNDLLREHGSDLFGNQKQPEAFPLLIKLLDCNALLSVQVHPDDEHARLLLGEPNGKTEAWYILDAEPDAVIYAGLKPGVTKESVTSAMKHGTVEKCLYSFHPRKGDCLFVPAGLVHAVGGGVVMAEVQQSSDATFRMFDWNRVDPATGKPRPLHQKQALECIDYTLGPRDPILRPAESPGSGTYRELVDCPYFRLGLVAVGNKSLVIGGDDASVWIVADGTARLTADGYERNFRRGETVLIPATCKAACWQSAKETQAELLRIDVPCR